MKLFLVFQKEDAFFNLITKSMFPLSVSFIYRRTSSKNETGFSTFRLFGFSAFRLFSFFASRILGFGQCGPDVNEINVYGTDVKSIQDINT